MQMFKRFLETFKRSLDDFWIDNVHGLDVEKFERELVHPARTQKLLDAVKDHWGRDGVAIVKRLLPKHKASRKRCA